MEAQGSEPAQDLNAYQKDAFDCQSPKRRRLDEPSLVPMHDRLKEVSSGSSEELDCENNIEPLMIHDLFDELLQKIFSYFPAQQLFGTLSKVCMRWDRIAKDPCTLNQTQLFLDEKDHDLCAQVLKEAHCIGEVYIFPSYPPDALALLIQGPTVRKLVIIGDSDWYWNWPTLSDLIALLSHNKLTLQHLSMQVDQGLIEFHKSPEALGRPSFQSIIAGMKRLTHLHLVGKYWKDWDEWDLTQQHPHLRTLKIDSLDFDPDDCPFIRDLIFLCKPTLRVLCLPCQLPENAISLLNAGVFEGSLVEELTVSTGCIRVVSQMPYLKILAIADSCKEDKDLEWFKKTPVLSGVRKLVLQNLMETNEVKQGFVWHLLSKFNNVREFWGLETFVDEETFNMFLQNNLCLEEMHFFDFTGFDCPNQVTLIENFLPHLRVLDLALSPMSSEMNAALHCFNERNPNVKIVYGDEFDESEMLPFTEGL